jgi:hypothetical protein
MNLSKLMLWLIHMIQLWVFFGGDLLNYVAVLFRCAVNTHINNVY